jgi:nucleoside-diphosphate-sugar epimerase
VSYPSPFVRPEFLTQPVNYTAFRGQSVGLSGHRGVLGSILQARLQQQGITVHAYPGNINDQAALGSWFAAHHFSHFFHFAALVPVALVEKDPMSAYQTNVIGTFNICQQLQLTQHGCWLFHCSSSHVYKPTPTAACLDENAPLQPQTFYGVTKLAAERVVADLLDKLVLPYCIGRVFSFSHASQAEPYLVPTLRRRIGELADGATLQVVNPSAVRDIQDADTVVDCILQLAQRGTRGTFNIGTGVGLSVREIAFAVARQLGKSLRIDGVDRDAAACLIADTHRLKQALAS